MFYTEPSMTNRNRQSTREMTHFQDHFGSWAIVTGASSGIGREFSHQLAQKGLNLVLVARREVPLTELSQELESTYHIQTRVVVADLSQDKFLENIEQATRHLDVGLLVSNAGAGAIGAFTTTDRRLLQKMVRLNVLAQMEIVHYFSQRLLDERKPGGIIMLSSMIAFQPTPYAADYSAGKAYILNLGAALNQELKQSGIHVTVLVPGSTSTPAYHDRSDSDFDKLPIKPMSAQQVVREGLIALEHNEPFHVAGKINQFLGALGRLLPKSLSSRIWGGLMKSTLKLNTTTNLANHSI
jgi:uncharacterized protein